MKKISCSINTEKKYFTIYVIVSFGLPVLPVLLALSQNKYGIPFYYIKGHNVINNFSGEYFTIPLAVLLLFCFCCLSITFYAFGTRQPKLPNEHFTQQAILEYEEFFKLKQTFV